MREWFLERKRQLIAGLVFVALSLAVFFGFNGARMGTPTRAARRYMDAAIRCDAMGMYNSVDRDVLGWLVEYYKQTTGVDTVDVAAMAAGDSAGIAGYLQAVEDRGVQVAFDYTVTGTSALEPGVLERLRSAYDLIPVHILEGKRVTLEVTATLTKEGEKTVFTRELPLTTIRTPRGWGLEANEIYAFPNLLLELSDFAQEQFG